MQESQADFTLTFRALALAADSADRLPLPGEPGPENLPAEGWLRDWQERVAHDPQTPAERAAAMRRVNPAFIPRNHRVLAALDAADAGDYTLFLRLVKILQRPFDEQADLAAYTQPPQPSERVLQTFCGT